MCTPASNVHFIKNSKKQPRYAFIYILMSIFARFYFIDVYKQDERNYENSSIA